MPLVDVAVVSYNSSRNLRACAEPLAGHPELRVIVADNASTDGALETVSDLPVVRLALPRNGGFAHGCNAGAAAGEAPYVLFLNPDAVMEPAAVLRLVRALEDAPDTAAVGPKILHADGSLEFSQRRFPRLRSTYAQALFAHRFLPWADWTDELVRDEGAYAQAGPVDWLSGASILIRRTVLDALGGMDERFFMYCEDVDLCRRVWDAGYAVRFEPDAVAVHEGGASAPRASLLPTLAESRLLYARKHRGRTGAALERGGIALGALTHLVVARRSAVRAGHARSLRLALTF
jgi:N-acetylglucosaminyl-diphospho-decaprenol L-rhamnosyltransferase